MAARKQILETLKRLFQRGPKITAHHVLRKWRTRITLTGRLGGTHVLNGDPDAPITFHAIGRRGRPSQHFPLSYHIDKNEKEYRKQLHALDAELIAELRRKFPNHPAVRQWREMHARPKRVAQRRSVKARRENGGPKANLIEAAARKVHWSVPRHQRAKRIQSHLAREGVPVTVQHINKVLRRR